MKFKKTDFLYIIFYIFIFCVVVDKLVMYDVDWNETIYNVFSFIAIGSPVFVMGYAFIDLVVCGGPVHRKTMSLFKRMKRKGSPHNCSTDGHKLSISCNEFEPAFYECVHCKRNDADGSLHVDYKKMRRLLNKGAV